MKKKILFIIWSFSYGGGAEKILSNIVNNLDKEKYDIDILEYYYIDIKKEKINDNINLLPPIIDVKNRKLLNRIKNTIVSFLITRCPKLIRKIYLNKTYDVEIAFNYMIPTFLLNDKSKKKISWMHGAIYDIKNKKKEFRLQKKALINVDNIVAISNRTYDSIIDLYPEFKNKTTIINNGFEFDKILEFSKNKTEENITEGVDILFCGRLDSNKNPLKMLEILNIIKEKGYNYTLGYLGTGELLDKVKEKVHKFGLENNVKMFGYQNNPYSYMDNCKLICMTSYSEGFPTVIIEGMTLGKPFISTSVAGVDEMSDNYKCGFIEDDINDYSDKIIELLNNKELYRVMSDHCKKYVKKFSMKNQINKLEELINKE